MHNAVLRQQTSSPSVVILPVHLPSERVLDLFFAARISPLRESLRQMRVILHERGQPINARSRSKGFTALHVAAHIGSPRAVAMLLAFGANPMIGDSHGVLPEHVAVLRKRDCSLLQQIKYGIIIRLLRRAALKMQVLAH